jgi:hypothetical protein
VVLLCEECISRHVLSPGSHRLIRNDIKVNESGFRCEGRAECSYPLVNACNCGNQVVLLCEKWISDHTLRLGSHRLIKTNTAKQIQAKNIANRVFESYPIKTPAIPIYEKVENIINFEEVKLPHPISTLRAPNLYHSRLTTYNLKYATNELVKYDSVSLNSLPYKLSNAATCMLPDGSLIITGGYFYDS